MYVLSSLALAFQVPLFIFITSITNPIDISDAIENGNSDKRGAEYLMSLAPSLLVSDSNSKKKINIIRMCRDGNQLPSKFFQCYAMATYCECL